MVHGIRDRRSLRSFLRMVVLALIPLGASCGANAPGTVLIPQRPDGIQQQKLELPAAPVVNIEVRFLSVEDNFLRDVGVDLRGLSSPFSYSELPGSPGQSAEGEDLFVLYNAIAGENGTWSVFLRGLQGFMARTPPPSSTGVSTFVVPPFGPNLLEVRDGYKAPFGWAGRVSPNPLPLRMSNRQDAQDFGAQLGLTFLDDLEVSFLLQAAEQANQGSTLSAPAVTVYDGQRAFILGENDFTESDNLEPEFAQVIEAFQSPPADIVGGVTLDFVPVIFDDRSIRLHVTPSIGIQFEPNQLADFDGFPIPLQIPVIQQSALSTTVTVPDGGTVLLGGLKRRGPNETLQEGVPILNKVPIQSFLFSRKGFHVPERRLLLLVRAQIVIQEEE